jgi:type IV pilus assembly protein PilY1
MYYYMTDLRTADLSNCIGVDGGDVCANNVATGGQDTASWQHMTLFTLGMGASGQMKYSPTYMSDNSSSTIRDYYDVYNGTAASSTVCIWQGQSEQCNWPHPGMTDGSGNLVLNTDTTAGNSGMIQNIDDMWHAAVNGRGTYFSASDPASLANGLSGALSGVSALTGASSSATTSTPNVTATDNFVFSTSYVTQEWTGQLIRQRINVTTGALPAYNPADSTTYDWAAQSVLDNLSTRTIYYASGGTLKPFQWANLSNSEKAYFTNISGLSQVCMGSSCLDAASQTNAAGEPLVNFLRGERTNEGGSSDPTKYYRLRTHLLGDLVDSEAIYVKGPVFSYADNGYASYKQANSSRQSMVYVGGNDGMLHAFNGSTGAEVWAFIPSKVLPNLYKLADKNYANLHEFYVDGTPVVGEICASDCGTANAEWKTILVGGLRGGGRAYYALDISDPSQPALLWEFTDTNLGYSFGNPVITKLVDGTWVALLTSGYNNVSPGDGVGRLYVVDAASGNLIQSISTGAGDTSTPSGLARIKAWVNNTSIDNTTLRVYGGDVLGNVWRIDINNNVGYSGYDAQLLANLTDTSLTPQAQPVTASPELGYVKLGPSSGAAVVFVPTGRFLGPTDRSDVTRQTVYAIKDDLAPGTNPSTAIYGHPRESVCATSTSQNCFVRQTLTVSTCPTGMSSSICTTGETIRTGTNNSVDFSKQSGWFVDLPDTGERVNTDPGLVLGVLVFNSNTPSADACSLGGYSNQYYLDYRTGGYVATAAIPATGSGSGGSGGTGGTGGTGGGTGGTGAATSTGVVGVKLGNALRALGSSPVFVRLPNSPGVKACTRLSNGTNECRDVPFNPLSGLARIISWRELISE